MLVFDLESFTECATSFQRWRMKRLLNKLSAPQQVLIGKIDSIAIETQYYDYSPPVDYITAYVSDGKYLMYDTVVQAFYVKDTYDDFYDVRDHNSNKWYRTGERIHWSKKLYKALILYNSVMSEYTLRTSAAHSRDNFMNKLMGTDHV